MRFDTSFLYIYSNIIANSSQTTEINEHKFNLFLKFLSFYAGD
jgi:hypothetical protein